MRSALSLRRHVFGQPRHGLRQALVGAVFLDDAGAFFRRRECAVPGEPGLAAKILEGECLLELHRLDVVAAAVVIGDALGRKISSKVMRFW